MPNIFTGAFPQSVSSLDRYSYEGLPPELAAEEQAINRKQQMANYLIQQGLQPAQGQMAGRFYVPPSPWQGLAGLAQTAAGVYGGMQADKARQGISGKSNEMLQQALQSYQQATAPRTTEGPRPTAMVQPEPVMSGIAPQAARPPVETELPGPGAPVSTPVSPEQRQQAIVEQLMLSRHPQAQRVGEVLGRFGEAGMARAEQREFMGEQKKLDRQNRIDTMQAQFGKDIILATLAGANKEQIQQMKDANAKTIADIKARDDDKAPTLATIVDPTNPQQSIVVDARRGNKVVGVSPKVGDIEKAKLKTEASYRGLGDMLQTAEDLLTGVSRGPEGEVMGSRQLPTGSKVGSLADTAAGWFGMSPSGAEEARQLKLVGAGLVSKVPRMEGPQSDKDVQLYKDMAADVGNDALPRGQRLAALKTMRTLYGKYEHLNRPSSSATPPAGPTGPAPMKNDGWSIQIH